MNKIVNFLMNWRFKLLIGLAGLFLLAGLFGAGYLKGEGNARLECEKAKTEGVKLHGEVEKQVMGLSDPDLDARLSKWMRD